MTPDQKAQLHQVFATCTGYDLEALGDSEEEALMLKIAVAFWNAGADAMGTAVEMESMDYYEGERLSQWVKNASKATLIRD